MTIKKIAVVAAALGVWLSVMSCGGRQQAIKFNDGMLKIDQAITASGKVWGDSLSAFKEKGEYGGLKPLRLSMEKDIDRYITEVEQMEPCGKGGEQFKREELAFLKVEKRVVHKGFSPFENLTATSTGEEIQSAKDTLNDVVADESVALKRLQEVQKQYANDNNMMLVEKKL